MRFLGLLIIYLEIFVSAIEVDLPWDIATKWCRHHLLFWYNFLLTDDDKIFRGLLESQARQVIKNALNNFSMRDHIPHSSLGTKGV